MRKRVIVLLSLFALTACAMTGTDSGVSLQAARSGRTVLLTLRNGSAVPVGYNLCSSTLQRQSGAAWEPVQTGEMCTMELRTLQSGDSATHEKTLPSDLGSGQFRYVANVDAEGQRMVVTSNPFAVE